MSSTRCFVSWRNAAVIGLCLLSSMSTVVVASHHHRQQKQHRTNRAIRRQITSLFTSAVDAVTANPATVESVSDNAKVRGGSGKGGDDDDDDDETYSSSADKVDRRGSSSSWLDGMEFEDYDPSTNANHHRQDFDSDSANAVLDDMQLHPLLQIPLGVSLTDHLVKSPTPVKTFCDTAATRTVMSWSTAQRLGLLQHLDRRYVGHATGVGSCRVLGRLHAGTLELHLHGRVKVSSPPITILESTGGAPAGVELLLGLDFLREHEAILDLRNEELRVRVKMSNDGASSWSGSGSMTKDDKQEFSIPFIRPRSRPDFSSRGGSRDFAQTVYDEDESHHESYDNYMDDDPNLDDDEDDYDDNETIDMSGV